MGEWTRGDENSKNGIVAKDFYPLAAGWKKKPKYKERKA